MIERFESDGSSLLSRLLPWVMLAILAIYTFGKFYAHPYTGFRVGPPGDVIMIFADEASSGLKIGDQIIQVGPVTWDEYRGELRNPIFSGVQRGDEIPLVIERDGVRMTIDWIAAGFNPSEFLDIFISEGWLGFFFWLAGTFAYYSQRPRDARWRLMIGFNYLTAFWLVLGSGISFYHIWGSAVLLRMAIWLCVPVYLHLHWVSPSSLGKLPKWLVWFVYGASGLLAAGEWFRLLDDNLYVMGFLLAVGGSILLLTAQVILRRESRRDLRFLLLLFILSLVPSFVIGIVLGFMEEETGLGQAWLRSGGVVLGLSLFPIAHLYGAFRRRLGNLELRVNGILTMFTFVILLGSLEVLLIMWFDRLLTFNGEVPAIGIASLAATSVAFIFGYPAFERFFESRILGITLPAKRLLEIFSRHITTSSSILELTRITQGEVMPSLLVRQFAFFQVENGNLKLLSVIDVAEDVLPVDANLPGLLRRSGVYLNPEAGLDPPLGWIRLILPLRIDDRLIGFWLFGRRDPDDLYSQSEIPILRSLANQTAVALSNLVHARQIREINELNIERHEQERLRLARDLHDSVLNELAALMMSSDAPALSPKFQEEYEEVSHRLKEIVSDLRPPMLDYGLKLAFEGLADNLMDRHRESVTIAAEVVSEDEGRHPEEVEINLYRIVQEACQNALRYAHAKTIRIQGSLSAHSIEITVEDDGIGFVTEVNLRLTEMLANKHFGLANMLERANLIGAEVKIESKPGDGTRVGVKWEGK